jgi:hypothetical protein
VIAFALPEQLHSRKKGGCDSRWDGIAQMKLV